MLKKILDGLRWCLSPFTSAEERKQQAKILFPPKKNEDNRAEWSWYKQELVKWSNHLIVRHALSVMGNFLAGALAATAAVLVFFPLRIIAESIQSEPLALIATVATHFFGAAIAFIATYRILVSWGLLKSWWFAQAVVYKVMASSPNGIERNDFTFEMTSKLEMLLIPRSLYGWLNDAPGILNHLMLCGLKKPEQS